LQFINGCAVIDVLQFAGRFTVGPKSLEQPVTTNIESSKIEIVILLFILPPSTW
jgi:hypothetical protein